MKMIIMIYPCVFHMKFILIQGMSFTNSKGIAKLQNLEPLKISVLWSTVKCINIGGMAVENFYKCYPRTS